MTPKSATTLFLACVLSLLIPTSSHAMTLQYAPVETLFQNASHIVEGYISASRIISTPNAPHIFTEYTLTVTAPLKCTAPCPDTLLVRIPGGKHASGRTVTVDGMPTIPSNTPLLIALEPLPSKPFPNHTNPSYIPLGLEQSIFQHVPSTRSFTRTRPHANLLCGSAPCSPSIYTRTFSDEALRALAKSKALSSPARTP